jgi:hypothetical protein
MGRAASVALLAAVAGLAVLAGCTSAAGHGGAPTTVVSARPLPASTSRHWQIVYRTKDKQVQLDGIASISPSDAWVVGTGGFPRARLIVLNWDGASWRSVRPPAGPRFVPQQVMASSADNVWILGLSHAGGPTEIFRFDGDSWRAVPMPPGHWGRNLTAVVSPADAWLTGGGCKWPRWPWDCASTLAQWTGTRWREAHLGILVTGLAEVGGHVWVVGVTGTRPPSGGEGSGHIVLLQQSGPDWQPIAAPAGTVGGTSCESLPQLAAGADGTSWVMCTQPARGKAQQGTLSHWSSGRWTQLAIPATVSGLALTAGSQLTSDGRLGVWVGPSAHWTGRQWVNVSAVGPAQAGTVYLEYAAGIPGSGSSWSIGSSGAFIVTVPSGTGVIAVNGPMPG